MPIHAPKNGEQYQRNPQKAHACMQRRRMMLDRQNRFTGATCAREKPKKKDNEPEQWQTGYLPRPPTSSD